MTALSLILLSNALAVACGVPAFHGGPYEVGAALWSIFTAALAFFVGGMVTEYLTRRGETHTGMLHGILAWVVAVNLTALLSMPVFGIVHGFVPLDAMRAIGPGSGTWTATSINIAEWGVFLSLLVGMVSAAFGGMMGYRAFEAKS